MKKIILSILLLMTFALYSCGNANQQSNQDEEQTSNEQTSNEKTPEEESTSNSETNTSVYRFYEAEDSVLDSVTIGSQDNINYVFLKNSGSISFTIKTNEKTKAYLKIKSYGLGAKKNNISLNNQSLGQFSSEDSVWSESYNNYITLLEGENKITITPDWGWIYVDYIQLINPKEVPMIGFTNFIKTPCNSNASDSAKKLMAEIGENYGKKIISGQMDLTWNDEVDMDARVFSDTGKHPKLMGYDFMNYLDYKSGSGLKQTDEAIKWWKKGGYVQFCWHWRIKGANGNNSFKVYNSINETGGTDFVIPYNPSTNSWDKSIDSDGDGVSDYNQIISDMDEIAIQLSILQDQGVPVLWRPLHEGSGNVYLYDGGSAWFWWGNSGSTAEEKAKSYIALWKLMYDYFTNTKGLNNLLWVWNGQAADYYPGDNFVDFVGVDIYDTPKDYSSKYSKFVEAVNYCENPLSAPKMVALTENGTIPSPSECKEDGAMWAWFMTWNDANGVVNADDSSSFWTGEYYNENSHKKEVYDSEIVIKL